MMLDVLFRLVSIFLLRVFLANGRPFPPRNPGRVARSSLLVPPFTVANMTCEFFPQPLNHFDLPRNKSGFFQQRFCYYNGFVPEGRLDKAPVFFYTGNESPLEEYINHTGLIWESAPNFGAQVVFVEHRYEGQSIPSPNIPNCMAYAASYQALADFANFIEKHLFNKEGRARRPVIVFGGSYGGMLSAWMRFLYPHLVTGAIAASAPIGGFPNNRPKSIDAAFRVIRHGLSKPLPPTKHQAKYETNHCPDNLLATWPLIAILSGEETGRKLLQEIFRLCELPPSNPGILTSWAQSPWFDMAEGSFPYPSSYITFALLKKVVNLPEWPVQTACWKQSALHQDWGITFQGNQSDVSYNITYGDSGLSIAVDWDKAVAIFPCQRACEKIKGSESIRGLLESVRDAVSVWFNVTKDLSCYNLTAAPNLHSTTEYEIMTQNGGISALQRNLRSEVAFPAEELCRQKASAGSWPSLCCNEEVNLIITDASGLGRDVFWPPSHPRGTESYSDIYSHWSGVYDFCLDPEGIFGFPQSTPDPWATWMDVRYGGLHVSSHSNIIFSNGLLDPWSAAGVYAKGGDPSDRPSNDDDEGNNPNWQPYHGIEGLYVQNITGDDRLIALVLEVGGHHTDLMYSNPGDPASVRYGRELQRDYMHRWIQAFWRQELTDM